MATVLHSTRFTSPSTATTSFDVTIPATAAGSAIVIIAGGNATIQAKLGGSSGTSFTKRTSSLSTREVVAQDIVDSAGGTTTVNFGLNGAQNIDGMIYEFASGTLGSFVTGATEGGSSTDAQGQVATSSITTSGATILFMMFTSGDNNSAAGRRFWGMEPTGRQDANGYIQPDGGKLAYWSQIGISQQDTAGTFTAKSSHIAGGEQQSVVWAYTNMDTSTPAYTDPYANEISRENSKPGSLYSAWSGVTTNANIAGYTDSLSYAVGGTVNFKVDSGNVGFTIDIFRVGYYGYVLFGAKSQATVTGTPAVQPSPSIDSSGGTVCAWSTTATWSIPATATPGVYIYNMRRTDNTAFLAQGLFVVRAAAPSSRDGSKIAVITSDFTWQAYNVWGATTDSGSGYGGFTGRSLYGQAPGVTIGSRAFAVSYDRPFGTIGANPQSYYWESEGALTGFLEGNGYDVHYYTSVDLDKDPAIPSTYGIVVSSGHDEYWSVNKRDAFENARDAGTSIIILSSNTALWHVRFDSGDTNRRTMICYKDSHNTTGYDNTTKYDSTSYTGTWRDARTTVGGVNNTNRRPEPALGGQWFIGNGTFVERAVVPSTYRSLPIWRNSRLASSVTISVRGTSTSTTATAATSLTVTQPSSAQEGDLMIIAATFGAGAPDFSGSGMRVVRQTNDTSGQTTVIMQSYVVTAGAASLNFTWNSACLASFAMVVYANAMWEDPDSSMASDHSGSATHTTQSIANNGSTRWAVCVFGDSTASNITATTSWTAGTGLTSRVQTDTSAAASGRWTSTAIMDTNGAVTQGSHQYSATAQFANSVAAAGIMYISPGQPLYNSTIGAEWDYVKTDEPTTPTNLVRLSSQMIALIGQASNYAGNDYTHSGLFRYGFSLYRASSGALVFNAGTWRYQWGINRMRGGSFDVNGSVDAGMQQALINIIRDMGIAPSTLLTTTANGDGTALVDPGAAAAASDYGFDVPAPTTYQTIFKPQDVPANLSINDNTDYTLGTLFSSASSGKVYGIRWYFPEVVPNQPVIGVLYNWTSNSSGTELARITFSNNTTGWNQALFSSPVDIAATTKYLAAVWTADYYVSTNATFTSSGITNGDLTAPQDSTGAHNGKFLGGAGSPSYPTQSFQGSSYFADVLYIGSTVQFEGWGLPLG